MKKALLLFIMAGFVSIYCEAQTGEAIETTKIGLFKNQKAYKKCGITMSDSQLMDLFKEDPNMASYLKPLALNYMGEILLSSASTILILWPLSDYAFGEGDPNWNLAYIGAGCALLSIPFKRGFEKNADQAVKFYNNGYQKVAAEFRLNMDANGLGLAVKF